MCNYIIEKPTTYYLLPLIVSAPFAEEGMAEWYGHGMAEWVPNPSPGLGNSGIQTHDFKRMSSQTDDLKFS